MHSNHCADSPRCWHWSPRARGPTVSAYTALPRQRGCPWVSTGKRGWVGQLMMATSHWFLWCIQPGFEHKISGFNHNIITIYGDKPLVYAGLYGVNKTIGVAQPCWEVKPNWRQRSWWHRDSWGLSMCEHWKSNPTQWTKNWIALSSVDVGCLWLYIVLLSQCPLPFCFNFQTYVPLLLGCTPVFGPISIIVDRYLSNRV